MRRLKTYPALASVKLPSSATVLDVHGRGAEQAPALVVSYDDTDAETEERRFAVLFPAKGDAVPPGAVFVASWRLHPADGGIACLFELAEDFPADLPSEAYPHWRVLLRDGFTLRPDRAWLAPDDVPAGHLSTEQIVAIATLQEYGYGSVVNA